MYPHGFRRLLRARHLVAVVALIALASGVWLVPSASAHNSLITASLGCSGPVSYTANAWSGPNASSRTNTDVRVSSSVDNGATWTQVGHGQFGQANGFSFSGTFPVGASSQQVRLRVQEMANWGDGAGPHAPGYATASRPTNCTTNNPPPPTTTTTTTKKTKTTPTPTTPTTTTSSPPATPPTPSLSVVKTERNGHSGSFVAGPLAVSVSDRLDYEIVVANTGSVKLTVALSDPGCRIRGGATLHVSGISMAPGVRLTYHCSHLIAAGDGHAYTNTVIATGVSAAGASVGARSSVVANVTTTAVKAARKVLRTHKITTVTHVTKKATPAKKVAKSASFTG